MCSHSTCQRHAAPSHAAPTLFSCRLAVCAEHRAALVPQSRASGRHLPRAPGTPGPCAPAWPPQGREAAAFFSARPSQCCLSSERASGAI
eukprot:scaffold189_cov249-Pinguiococcus_pyrenoidosus.AAC.23